MIRSDLLFQRRFLFFILPFLIVIAFLCEQKAIASSQPYLVGHGINFASGNKYLVETDLVIQGPLAPLSFTRTYNSTSSENSILGYGWSCSFTDRLQINEDGIIRVLSTGRHITYDAAGNGSWITRGGKSNTIEETADGYQLTTSKKDIRSYDAQGRLIQIQRRNGATEMYSYNGAQLVSMSNNFGTTLHFSYDAMGRLTNLSGPTGNFSYTYLDNNLVSVTRPDGSTREYAYQDANDSHNLTGVTDSSGVEIMAISYDAEDRVISSSLAGQRQVSITYPTELSRTITDDNGNQISYQLELNDGVARVTSSTGSGCGSCGGSEANNSYTYTARQQVATVTNGRGVVTSYTYDSNGNRTTITEAAGSTVERVISYSYDQSTNLLETITRDSVSNPGQHHVVSMSYDNNGNLLSRTENGFCGTTPISCGGVQGLKPRKDRDFGLRLFKEDYRRF